MNERAIVPFIFTALLFLNWISLGNPLPEENPVNNIRYEIWVELDHQNRKLMGKETIGWFNHTGEEIEDIWFHLYWNAFKNEKSAMMREVKAAGKGIRFGERIKTGEWGWVDVKSIVMEDGTDLTPTIEFKAEDQPPHPDDQTVMRVKLPQPLKPGERLNLKIEFESKIPKTHARAGYYLDSYFFGQWYPKPGVYEEGKGWNCHQYHQNSEYYADFAHFTVHMTVPENFVLGASGKEIKRQKNQEKGTVTYTHQQDNIHDFAWTVSPHYLKIERDFIAHKEVTPEEYNDLSKRLQLPLDQIKLKDVKMILLLAPHHEDQADRQFKALRVSIKYYGLWYGAYPYETMTLLDPPYGNACGGMEYPTLVTGGSSIFLHPDAGEPEFVIIHEFGHNFWYGMIANNEFEEAWLDEGINSYSDGKVMTKAYGPFTMPFKIGGIPYYRYLGTLTSQKYLLNRAAAINIVKIDPIVTYSWKFYNPGSYGMNVYMRAASCLDTLERILGEDVMLRVLRTFQTEFRFQHPNTQDFIEVVNRVSSRDMTWFFDELFFGTHEFDYGVSYVKSEEITTPVGIFDTKNGEKKEVTWAASKKTDKDKKEKKYFSTVAIRRYGEAKLGGDVKLKIKILFQDDTEEVRYWEGKDRWIKYTFTKPSKIKLAQVDPDNCFLIDSNFTNNSRKREPDSTAAKRWSNKLHFWIQNLLQMISGIS